MTRFTTSSASCRTPWVRFQDHGIVFGPSRSETLHVRMARHQDNAQALVEWLNARDDVGLVRYPGLAA